MKVGESHSANTDNLGLPGVNIDHECKLWWHWQQPDKKASSSCVLMEKPRELLRLWYFIIRLGIYQRYFLPTHNIVRRCETLLPKAEKVKKYIMKVKVFTIIPLGRGPGIFRFSSALFG